MIPESEWRTIVEHVPIVSVDLVVRAGDDVVLGKRRNEPAKGEWFVPGGRVHKHERLTDAVHRIAADELGIDVRIKDQLGVYEHFYDDADFDGVNGKHYVPIGFAVSTTATEFTPDAQHTQFERFDAPFDSLDLHPYIETYLRDAGFNPPED